MRFFPCRIFFFSFFGGSGRRLRALTYRGRRRHLFRAKRRRKNWFSAFVFFLFRGGRPSESVCFILGRTACWLIYSSVHTPCQVFSPFLVFFFFAGLYLPLLSLSSSLSHSLPHSFPSFPLPETEHMERRNLGLPRLKSKASRIKIKQNEI